jgi:hypothetical protein
MIQTIEDIQKFETAYKGLSPKLKSYNDTFGKPLTVVFEDNLPGVWFLTYPMSQFGYWNITCGMEEKGMRELVVYTEKKEEWPLFLLVHLASYEIENNYHFDDLEGYTFIDDISGVPPEFKNVFFLNFDAIEDRYEEYRKKLNLKEDLLFFQLLTNKEAERIRQNPSREKIRDLLMMIKTTFSSVDRKSAI